MTKRLMPTGDCWCGCGEPTEKLGSFFKQGHDRAAEAAVILAEYGSTAQFLDKLGYGPGGRNPRKEAEKARSKTKAKATSKKKGA